MTLFELKVGDIVERNMAGVIMKLKISEIKDDIIYCGAWKFSRRNGAEIDEDLGWDESQTGSVIKI